MKALVSTCALAAWVAFVPTAAQASPAAEYVYAGARMLAVVKGELPQVLQDAHGDSSGSRDDPQAVQGRPQAP